MNDSKFMMSYLYHAFKILTFQQKWLQSIINFSETDYNLNIKPRLSLLQQGMVKIGRHKFCIFICNLSEKQGVYQHDLC